MDGSQPIGELATGGTSISVDNLTAGSEILRVGYRMTLNLSRVNIKKQKSSQSKSEYFTV